MSADSIAQRHKRDLAQLDLRRKRLKRLFLLLVVGCVFLFVRLLTQIEGRGSGERLVSIYENYSHGEAPNEWAYSFVVQQRNLSSWLSRYGIALEVMFFDSISEVLLSNGLAIPSTRSLSFFSRASRSLQYGLMHIVFVVLASWRLWFAITLFMSLRAYFRMSRRQGRDMLSETGNGRLFYSGIRVGLENLNMQGCPGLHVTGLACPDFRPPSEVHNAELGRILNSFGAANQTNIRLAGIILAHAQWPAYVPFKEESAQLEAMFEGGRLGDKVALLLNHLLSLHQRYCAKDFDTGGINPVEKPLTPGKKQSLSEYAHRVGNACERVLTPSMREHIGLLNAAQLATLVLGYEAGIVLAVENHSGLWLRRSNFSQLCGRAVLHSVPFYGSEYDVDQRATMRRALVYGSRRSVFAPVRFPIDLSLPARAARQWVELLMACPHELEQTADEVELVGLVYESHSAWEKTFYETVGSGRLDLRQEIFASHSNLFLMPLPRVMATLRRVVSTETVRRLETLGNLIYQRVRLHSIAQPGEENAERISRMLENKPPPPLSVQEIRDLATQHGLSAEDVRDWSSLRVVLTSYGWLARRVGDYTVPLSSLIFAVMKESLPHPDSNSLGLIGRAGMVPFRATKLAEHWGKQWTSYFCEVDSAGMAENREKYEKLLAGSEDSVDDGDSSSGGSSLAVG